MKKLIPLIALFTSIGVSAHLQSPVKYGYDGTEQSKLTSIVTSQTAIVPVTIHVGDGEMDSLDGFDIEVDDVLVHSTDYIYDKEEFNVPIKMNEPMKLEEHTICTVSRPKQGSNVMFRTKVCTKARLMWVK